MTIRVSDRRTGDHCCFCLDGLDAGRTTCPGCGAGYHDECSAITGRCVILGCRERLGGGKRAVVVGRALPRLGILARAIGRWARLGIPDEVDLGSAVVLLPSRREVKDDMDAARAVAELLGPEHTPYDGRLRLQSPHPEPLVRVDDHDAAIELLARLRGEGISCMTVPLRELLAPLELFEPVDASTDPLGVAFLDEQGRELDVAFAAPRLVLVGQHVEVERKVTTRQTATLERTAGGKSPRYTAPRSSLFPEPRKSSEPCVHVLFPGQARLLFLRRGLLRSFGKGLKYSVHAIQPWYKLVEDLKQGAMVIEVAAAGSPALLSFAPEDPAHQSNGLAIHLLARIWRAAWQSDHMAPPRQRVSVRPPAPPPTRTFQVRGTKPS